MGQVSMIGLDTAKRVFQVHGVDDAGAVVLRRQLRRTEMLKFFAKLPRCVVGMEACAAAHYWGREIAALGHEVRLMPPTRVKPYVKWGRKSDKVDAAACCEAVSRPSMRFVPIKTVEQQAALMMHRVRQLLVEQRTRLGNAIRGHMSEVGIIAAKGDAGLAALLAMIGNPEDQHVPAAVRPILVPLVEQWSSADVRSPSSSARSWPGTAAAPTAAGSPPSRNMARSYPAPWPPRSATPLGSITGGLARPGSAWCRSKTPAAAANI